MTLPRGFGASDIEDGPTERQLEYAQQLINRLEDAGEPMRDYENKVDGCDSITEMSALIQEMLDELGAEY